MGSVHCGEFRVPFSGSGVDKRFVMEGGEGQWERRPFVMTDDDVG